jgi:hypothetical protein
VSPFDPSDILDCADCGATTMRRSPNQRYCASCSGIRDTARKAAWAKANPQIPRPDHYERQQSKIVEAGVTRSAENRGRMDWLADIEEIPFNHLVRVAVPFDWAFSKNAVWRHGRGGHVYARKEAVDCRAGLAAALARSGGKWFAGKVWIDIYVEKPNHRGDATNVIDLVCDAVKDAIGVDDRWYSIRRLDWSIVKDNPRILVGVAQDAVEDHQVCSHCGRVLVLEEFGKNSSAKNGRARVCRDCSAPVRGRRAA